MPEEPAAGRHDTAMLNRFFTGYRKGHTQGGTNTLQRNLAHLFGWLEQEEFIKDMLEVTGGGRARSFEDVRDHAIIRVFTEGPRLTEVTQMEVASQGPGRAVGERLCSQRGRITPLVTGSSGKPLLGLATSLRPTDQLSALTQRGIRYVRQMAARWWLTVPLRTEDSGAASAGPRMTHALRSLT